MPEWKLRTNGDVEVAPLVGWQVVTIPMTAIVQLRWAETDAELLHGVHASTQLAMTGPQCRELATVLLRTADRIDQQPRGTKQ